MEHPPGRRQAKRPTGRNHLQHPLFPANGITALHDLEWKKFHPMIASEYRSRVVSILSNIQYRRYVDFSRFIDNVLLQHKNLHCVRRFRLHYQVKKPFVRSLRLRPDLWFYWFEKAVSPSQSELEELDVRIDGEIGELPYRIIRLPDCFYTPKNLRVLKLEGVLLESAHESVLLPSVKMLQLVRVKTMDCESFSRLISACPVLETAHLESCSCSCSISLDKDDDDDEEEEEEDDNKLMNEKKDIVVASIPSLNKLTIIGDRGSYGDTDITTSTRACPIVVMEAPSLEHLHVQDFAELQFVDSQLSCLVSARIDISESRLLDHCVIGFLAQISNAKELYLSSQTMRLLSVVVRTHVQLPVFPNLTHLTIEPAGSSCLLLHSLLVSAPKLRVLVIDLGGSDRGAMEWEEESEPATRTPKCLLSSLEEIEIKDLVAEENEMKMARYLLNSGAVLKIKKVNNTCLLHPGDGLDIDEDLKLLAPLPNPPRGPNNNINTKEHLVKRNQIDHTIEEEFNDIIDADDDEINDPENYMKDMISRLKTWHGQI